MKLDLYRTRRSEDLAHKAFSCRRVKVNPFAAAGKSGLTKENALRIIEEKKQKELMTEEKKKHNNFMRMWRIERDDVHIKGVTARKLEKARVKSIKDLMKENVSIPEEMLIPIEDPEAKLKTENNIWKAEELKKKNAKNKGILIQNNAIEEEDKEEILFVIDTEGDKQLSHFLKEGSSIENQDDFVTFDDNNKNDEENENEIQHLIKDYQ